VFEYSIADTLKAACLTNPDQRADGEFFADLVPTDVTECSGE